MKSYSKYIIAFGAAILIGAIAWYFSRVIIYILLSAAISLMASPLMALISSIKFKRFQMPRSVAALLTILILLSLFLLFFLLIAPLLGSLFTKIGSIRVDEIESFIAEPFAKINHLIHRIFPSFDREFKIERELFSEFKKGITTSTVASLFSSVAGMLLNSVMALFVILFITFFFLKEQNMFNNIVIAIFPEKYESNVKRALKSINTLLVRYFVGVTIQIGAITLLTTVGLHFIVGLEFSYSLVLAFIIGVLNTIPYVGPWIGAALAVVITLVTQTPLSLEVSTLIFRMVALFLGVHLIDNIIFQPFIFSSSVKAHPLEIFLVVIIAAGIAGILGMLIAIPAYTVLRVFAKEFFSHLKVVQKLTDKIEN